MVITRTESLELSDAVISDLLNSRPIDALIDAKARVILRFLELSAYYLDLNSFDCGLIDGQ